MEAHFRSARVLVAGLGLIGGSVARALRQSGLESIDALDTDAQTLANALADGVIEGDFRAGEKLYDAVICSLAPGMVEGLYGQVNESLKPSGVFIELSGLKTAVVRTMTGALADGHELLCLHPMAGREKSGYAHSDATMFHGAPLILTPTGHTGTEALKWADFLRQALGCGTMPSIPADEHDRLVADLSHLPHIAALALRAVGKGHESFAGGSYRSMTRVAADINAPLWAGLLTDNAEYLLDSINQFREQLGRLEASVRTGSAAALEALLREISGQEEACKNSL